MRKDTTFNPDLTGVQNETRREQEAKKQAEEQQLTFRRRVSYFFKDGRTRLIIGSLFFLVGIFLCVAFFSFCFGAGDVDQALQPILPLQTHASMYPHAISWVRWAHQPPNFSFAKAMA